MIEAIDKNNLDEVLPLIREYQEFYQVKEIDDDRNKQFFSMFGPSSDKGCLFGYRKDGDIVAFATVYFTYASSITSKVGVMNDLFTKAKNRREGIATHLIRHCEGYAKSKGAVRLQWLTSSTNIGARSVYDALGASASSWELYTYTAQGNPI